MIKNREKILAILKKEYGEAECALNHKNALELLIATILSAQCTDKRVNRVTGPLFHRYRKAADFARADLKDLEKYIYTTGFYRQKAISIKKTAEIIHTQFNDQVPKTMAELLTLRGVARKTANVVLGTVYGIAEGVVVDTHVKRIAKKLGFTKNTDPVKIEKDLMKVLAPADWIWFSHALITHGRAICKAPTPLCVNCPLNKLCPASEV